MKFFLATIALVTVGASAQSATTTISAPCGTSCPSAAAPKMITRTAPAIESSPCPSLIVSSVPINQTSPTVMTGMTPTPSTFKGAANQLGGSVAAVVAVAAVAVML